MVLSYLRRRRAHRLLCQQAVELITDYLEGALSDCDRGLPEAHLAGCVACTAYFAQMRATLDVLGRLRHEELPPSVLDELVDLYRRFRAR